MEIDIQTLNREFEDSSATSIIQWVYETFDPSVVKLSTSFGAEGMVLIHLLKQQVEEPRVFTIDTGRNFQETYDVWQEAIDKYRIEIEAFYPETRRTWPRCSTRPGPICSTRAWPIASSVVTCVRSSP